MQRFAAANQGIGWGAAIGGITGWHIALDAAIEATIIAAGVTAALGATAAVVYPIIDQLAYHTRAAFDVMTAYGVDAGPLAKTTKQMDLLRQSLAPQVFEGFGGVLSLLGNHFNDVAGAARAVVNMFDTWIAKIDIWAGGQKSMNGLFQAGVGFLQQIGKAIGIFAQAIDNLLTKDPGIAHYLLNLIQGLAMLINLFSRLPAPVVQATLMIHGFYLWISVLLGVVGKLAAPLAGLATGFVQLALGKEALTIEKDATALDKLKASASLLGPSWLPGWGTRRTR